MHITYTLRDKDKKPVWRGEILGGDMELWRLAEAHGYVIEENDPEPETAWLIERLDGGGAPLWWAGGEAWTFDHLRAVRFARRVDADAVALAMHDRNMAFTTSTEHSWG